MYNSLDEFDTRHTNQIRLNMKNWVSVLVHSPYIYNHLQQDTQPLSKSST